MACITSEPGSRTPSCRSTAADLQPVAVEERPPFRSYRHALVDLLRNLPDPRVGAQWRTANLPATAWQTADAVRS